jgi:hypothetical protein
MVAVLQAHQLPLLAARSFDGMPLHNLCIALLCSILRMAFKHASLLCRSRAERTGTQAKRCTAALLKPNKHANTQNADYAAAASPSAAVLLQ